jgi:hypothetical protein
MAWSGLAVTAAARAETRRVNETMTVVPGRG